MAHKDFLKRVFHNSYRKSVDNLRSHSKVQPQPTPEPRAASAADLQLHLNTQASSSASNVSTWLADVPSGDGMYMTAAELRHAMNAMDNERKGLIEDRPISSSDLTSHLLDEAENMAVSHLDTIETTFTLLEALKGMSEHTNPIRMEMVKKRSMCERKLRELRQARGKGAQAETEEDRSQ